MNLDINLLYLCFGMKELLKHCRYYRGEEACPFEDQNKKMLWSYERSWVLDSSQSHDFGELVDEYVGYGLGRFSSGDSIPVSYKALLFNRYCKGCFSVAAEIEPFKKFYKTYYP